MLPAEYAAIGQPTGPQPFTVEDLVSIATLVGGIFGNGGGQQLSNAVLYENMKQTFGPEHVAVAGSPELLSTAQPKKKKHEAQAAAQGQQAEASRGRDGDERAQAQPGPRWPRRQGDPRWQGDQAREDR